MSFFKYFFVAAIAILLSGCGKHGFEGEHEMRVDSASPIDNSFVDAIASSIYGNKSMYGNKIVIGTDYTEFPENSTRVVYDKIFIRESGSNKFLIFEYDEDEVLAFQIIDEDTLLIFEENLFTNIKIVYARIE